MKAFRLTTFASMAILALCFAGSPLKSWALVQPPSLQTAPDNSAQNKDQGANCG